MRPRKGSSSGRPEKPQQKPPWNPEESSRRDDYSRARTPRKKILILDKDEKEPERQPSGVKKVYRKTTESEPGWKGKTSPVKRRSPGSDPDSRPKRRSFETGQEPVKKRRSSGDDREAGPKRRSFGTDREPTRNRMAAKPGFRKKEEAFEKDREKQPAERRTTRDYKPFREPGKGRGSKKEIQFRGEETDLVRLNKFIANAGVCSRREADELITAGAIRVNGKIVTELGVKVSRKDKIQYGDQTLRAEPMVYVLLNKPKGYITTADDPLDRNTVMILVKEASRYRIYPVGRLDRNTTGLLLFTNDGELAKKLTHPRHRIEKLYHVELDKNLTKNDLLTIAGGVELEDGFAKVDEIAYVAEADSKKEIGIRLHSGKNRIVRRIFEKLGYKVTRLDRTIFAGLTKKDLPRGRWRHLSKEEVGRLKRL